MLYRNLTILARTLWRQRSFTLINTLGLSIGIGASLLIFLLIRYELSIDSFHSNRDRIYRVVCADTYRNGTIDDDGCAPVPLADALGREFPQVEKVAPVMRIGQQQFGIPSGGDKDKQVLAHDVYYADGAFFDLFDFPWVEGDAHTALQEPFTAAVSQSIAASWFGDWHSAIGKSIRMDNTTTPYRITGVLQDPPSNTDLALRVVLSYATYRAANPDEWVDPKRWDNFSSASQCFFLLNKGQHIQSMEAGLPRFVGTHFTPLAAHSDSRDSCFFQPLSQMHFNDDFYRYGGRGWTYSEIYAMGLIGVFLLLVACINFINLATAQSFSRCREVGVRKVLGSSRGRLLTGFMGETAALVFLALIVGCCLAQLALPQLRMILEKPVVLDLSTPAALVFLMATGMAVTFLSGFYPGVILSRFNPIDAFKNKINTSRVGGISLRRGLIVLQFAIAQLLIIGTLVVVRQMDFFRNRPMGFDRQAIALVGLPGGPHKEQTDALFKTKVSQLTGVRAVSLCSDAPSTSGIAESNFIFENRSQPESFELLYRFADTSYFSVFHLRLAAGRSPYPSDTSKEALLTETAVAQLGFRSPAGILGKHIQLGWMQGKPITIVGVLKDFNNTPLREQLKPMAIFSSSDSYWQLAVKLQPDKIKITMSQIQTIYHQLYPDHFFNAPFFDDKIVEFYNAEAIEGKLFKTFAALAVFISGLGLYGLVSFMAVQKTKEVGIRKLLGASVSSIIYLFSREFILLIGLAFLIAAPVGYYLMQNWLSGYYYHQPIGWLVFALAILLSLIVALLVVGAKALKAAMENPAKSLKTE